MVRHIRLMTDYSCEPLWEKDSEDCWREIDLKSLPLQQETMQRLDHWAGVFDGLLNMDDPGSSGFETEAAEEDWIQEGVLLWKRLQQELGPDYKVSFHYPERAGELASLEELEELFPGKYTQTESPYSPEQIKESRQAYHHELGF